MQENFMSNNIFYAFKKICDDHPQDKAIYFKKSENYEFITYQKLQIESLKLGKYLIDKGIKKGDAVAIVMENHPNWPTAFMGIMYCGAKAVPLSPQQEVSELNNFFIHSQVKQILTSASLYPKIKEFLKDENISITCLDSEDTVEELGSYRRKEIFPPQIGAEEAACIIYTSGTTQRPKGVVLTHKNLLSNVNSLKESGLVTSKDCFISLLPLYHTYPLMVNLILPLLLAAKISYPPHIELNQMVDCIQKTEVTVLTVVPKLLSMFHQKIKKAIELSYFKKMAIETLLYLSLPLKKCLKINPAKIVLKELHAKFGKQFRLIISGGAKLKSEIARDLHKWGFMVLEGYGLTETSPVVSFNIPSRFKIGSTGKSIPGVEIEINQPDETGSGEISIKGENVFSGYFKEEKLYQETVKNGWFFTGDLGYMDKDGFLYLTGRRKEIIVLSSGKKVNPQEVEQHYSQSPYIEEICLFLSEPGRNNNEDVLTAVILPDYKQFQDERITQIRDKIRWEIEKLSLVLPAYKRLKKHLIINNSLPKTILGKIKRYEVEKKYAHITEEKEERTKELSPQDLELLASPICGRTLAYFSAELKRPLNLDDHLELDLGLDSLEQIGLFFGFQDALSVEISEEQFLGVSTIRGVLKKIKASSEAASLKETALNWREILHSPVKEDIKASISLRQSSTAKVINIIFLWMLKFITHTVFPLRVNGKENLPEKGPFILCPNHTSYLDGLILASSLDSSALFKTYFLGFAAYLKHPLIVWTNKLLRLIPIDTASSLMDSLKMCAFILGESKILCMFPEGIRSTNGKLGEFKRGVGILVKELNVPVVPVYIRGTYEAWPFFKRLPKLNKLSLSFGKLLTPGELASGGEYKVDIYKNIVDNLKREILNLKKESVVENKN